MESEFFALVSVLQSSALLHLGKIENPQTKKTEKNLVQAKTVIDILIMLEKKTKGNLSSDEEKFLSNVIAELQLNYAAESK